MRSNSNGFTMVMLLIALAIVAWLTLRSMKTSRMPTSIQNEFKEAGIQPPTDPNNPKAAADAVKSTIEQYEKRGVDRTERAVNDAQ